MTNIIAPVQYFSKYSTLTKLVQLRMVEITLDHGISDYSPNCFAFCAFAVFDEQNKEQFNAAIRCSRLGVAMAKVVKGKEWLQVIAPDAIVFRHWTQPHAADVDLSMAMYGENLKRGKLVDAFQAVALYLFTYYYSGLTLGPLVSDAKAICEIKMEYGQNLRLLHMLPIYQLVLNLTGESENILDMYNGKAMDFRNQLGWGVSSRDGEEAQWAYSLQLYVYCENWTLAGEMYDKMVKKDPGFLRSFPSWHNRVFFFALVAIHRAKVAPLLKRPLLKREIGKHMALMRLWVQQRKAINLVHKYQLLEAEMLTLKPKYPDDKALMSAYDKSLRAAVKSGYSQDAGLASALAARAMRNPLAQEDYALLAQTSYERWGALGVVQHLREKSEIHKRAEQRSPTSHLFEGFRSRRRFDATITSLHKEISFNVEGASPPNNVGGNDSGNDDMVD